MDKIRIGIVGYGNIGKKVAELAGAFGMKVNIYSRSPQETVESDVVSLHCPLTPDTKGIIDRKAISMMKEGAILINNSRGPLIVEQDVGDALNSGRLLAARGCLAAGVDVADTEPLSPDSPLLTAKNCIITPHISWAPRETRKRLMDIAVENLRAFLDGRTMNVVNNRNGSTK